MSDTLPVNVDEVLNQVEGLITDQKIQEAIDGLETIKDQVSPAESVRFYHLQGVALARLGRTAESMAMFRKSFKGAEEIGDLSGQAKALEYIGSLQHQQNHLEEAGLCYAKALKLYEKLDDVEGMGRGHRSLGNLAVDRNNNSAALSEYEKCCEIFRSLKMPEEMAPAIIHRATLLYQNKSLEDAIESFRKGIEEDGCRHYLVLNNYGFMLMLANRVAEGMRFFESSMEDIKAKKVNDDDLALVCLNLGVGYALNQEYAKAEEYLRQAAKLLESFPEARAVEFLLQVNGKYQDQGFSPYLVVDNGQKLALAHLNLAAVLAWTDRLEEAKEEALKGVACDNTAAYPDLAAGWIFLALNDEKSAAAHFNRACGNEPNNQEHKKALNLVNPYLNSKVGRNEPCPCGSGKKFKKCHGAM